MLRVDLTTAPGSGDGLLRRHFQELRRRVERVWRFKGIDFFAVETTEGHGVLHMVWAWSGQRSFYIDQAWLSETWEAIHGAPVVWVRKMRIDRKDIRCVGRYFALQYLADQRGALVRMSWSWHRCRVALARGWETVKRLASETYQDDTAKWGWTRVYVRPMSELIAAWESLLRDGEAILGETLLLVRGRDVVEAF